MNQMKKPQSRDKRTQIEQVCYYSWSRGYTRLSRQRRDQPRRDDVKGKDVRVSVCRGTLCIQVVARETLHVDCLGGAEARNNIRSGLCVLGRCVQSEAIAGVVVVMDTLMCKCVDGGVERERQGSRRG